jgi:DNA polymerase III subunit epsilon
MNSDKKNAVIWARKILANSEQYYILDTQTTGLPDREVVELALLDLDGEMIVNQRFSPTKKVSQAAINIHGITNESLVQCPSWENHGERIEQILKERKLLIYNFGYHNDAIINTYAHHHLRPPLLQGYCVMDWYSRFIGKWDGQQKNYHYQKLVGGDNSALGDCMAILEVLKGMAATEIKSIAQLVESKSSQRFDHISC